MIRLIILAWIAVMGLLMFRDAFGITPEQWIRLYQRDCSTVSEGKACRQKIEWSLGVMYSYRHMLLYHLEKADLPGWLSVIPVIESGYNETAESHAGAVGLWQFMRSTARRYNVTDRTDPVESTRAACEYLRFLFDRYKNWRLALMAYNAGEKKIDRWLDGDDQLMFETENYFEQIKAVNMIISDIQAGGEKYGFKPQKLRTKYVEYLFLRIVSL